MGAYRIECVIRQDCSAGRHISSAGIAWSGEHVHLDVKDLWDALKNGDWIYARVNGSEHTMVKALRCACGEPTVSARRHPAPSHSLALMPECSPG